MNVQKILSTYSEKEINKIKNNSLEMTTYAGQSLEDVVINLEQLRRNGKLNRFANFNGTKLYSIDVTMNNAYKECLGCTRKTWIRRTKREFEKNRLYLEQMRQESREKLLLWIEEGRKYIHPEKFYNWRKKCIYSALGDYCGFEIEDALEVMKLIEDGVPFNEIKKKIKNDSHSGMTYSLMMGIVLDYSKRGPAFYNYMNKSYIREEDKKYVSKIKELNKRLNQGQKYSQIVKDLKDYKAMNIYVSDNLDNKNYSKGVILVKEDGTFEGMLDEENYILGTLKENEHISFVKFDWDCEPTHYCAINQDGMLVGLQEFYSLDGIVNNGNVFVSVNKNYDYKTFDEEIALEYQMNRCKHQFSELDKKIYEFFKNNIESETKRSFTILRENLCQRLVDALTHQINKVKIKNL